MSEVTENTENTENKPEKKRTRPKPPRTTSESAKKGARAKVITQSKVLQTLEKDDKNHFTGQRRLTVQTQGYVRDELTKKDSHGTPYIHQFIKSFLKEAKENPNSKAATTLASSIFDERLLATLDAEVNKQMAKDNEFAVYRIRKTLYDKQQEVFDNTTDPVIECICTRRAGKTECVARILLRDVLQSEHNALYLNRSFDNAVSQMGKPVTDVCNSLGIKFEGSPGSGLITFENGSTIRFGGYNNKGDIDKYRGFKFSLVCVDEVAALRSPENLIKEVLEPAMIDYGSQAQLIMTGTPPRVKANYAYRMWHNPAVKHYHWSFMDNPFIPEKDKVIEKVCREHGVTPDAPFIQREYFGNVEALDTESLIFKGYKTCGKPDKNLVYDRAYIGVDFGFEDAAAVISCVVKGKRMYVIDEWSMPKQSISTICNEVMRQYNELHDNWHISSSINVITDTNEKSATYELYSTYKIPNVMCAYKYDKDMAIEQLAEWMRTDVVLIPSGGTLETECENTVWKRDENTDEITHQLDDEVFHPNAIFALLYVSRQFAYEALGLTETNKEARHIKDDIYV